MLLQKKPMLLKSTAKSIQFETFMIESPPVLIPLEHAHLKVRENEARENQAPIINSSANVVGPQKREAVVSILMPASKNGINIRANK